MQASGFSLEKLNICGTAEAVLFLLGILRFGDILQKRWAMHLQFLYECVIIQMKIC